MNRTLLPMLALLLILGSSADASGGPKVPVDLAWGPGGRLFVALREAKAAAVVDPKSWSVVDTWEISARPASLVLADDGETLLAGSMDGELVVVGSGGRVIRRLEIGRGPERMLPLSGGRALVGSPWDEAVCLVDWRAGKIVTRHPLPIAPGRMVQRLGGRVVVGDAFGGRICDLDPDTPGSARVKTIDGANLRALAVSGDGKELLLAHVAQYDRVPITRTNIDWGLVLSSKLSAVRLSEFDREGADEALPRRRLTLDGSVHGAADPSAMALSADGTKVVIALSGAHQLLLDDRTQGVSTRDAEDLLPLGHNQRLEVVEVGRSPVAVVLDPSGAFAVTADAMSDTLSVVGLASMTVDATVELSPQPPSRTAAQRGEALFLDGRRSLDRWMSCASCHPSGHTTGLSFDTLGDGDYGAPKNTPSLLGIAATRPFGWTGRFAELGDQIGQSLQSSLHGPAPEPRVRADLTAYLESLPAPPPRRLADDPAARRGATVFHARRCDTCHQPPLYTSSGLRDVGMEDEQGHRRFNPPSLRGVAWSAPFLHDGRARTLAELLESHSPGVPAALDSNSRDDLIAFLESL